mgnify:CR=1 FL=1
MSNKILDEFETSVTDTKIIAHNGGSWRNVIPNSSEAFQKSIDVGADGIQLDLEILGNEIICSVSGLALDKALGSISEDIILVARLEEIGYADKLSEALEGRNWQIVSFREEVLMEYSSCQERVGLMLGNPFTKDLSWKENLRDLKEDLFPKQKVLDAKIEKIIVADSLARFGALSRTYKRINHSIWGANDHKSIRKYLLDSRVQEIHTDYPAVAVEIRDELSNAL